MALGGEIGARGDSGGCLEQPVEVRGRQVNGGTEAGEVGGVFCLGEQTAGAGDGPGVIGGRSRGAIGTAFPAGAEAGGFGFGGSGMEGDVFRFRRARGAGRLAINAGGADRIDKFAIG